jgi:hypothetical protein
MFAAARVTLKQHHFEVAVAALAAVAASALGASIAWRIDALGVSKGCLDRVIASQDGFSAGQECFALVREGSGILGETFLTGQGTVALSIMGVLPFLLGLVGGVPIVARELEARTAQTAWTLSASRWRWLAHQVAPIAIVLGAVMLLAAFAAGPVADASVAWGRSAASLIGLHGPLAVVRAFAAFGVGLLLGALLGRSLPALFLGIAISVALLFVVGILRDTWTASLEPGVIAEISPETGEYQLEPRAETTGWGVVTPDGRLLSSDEAREIATAAGVPAAPPDDVQDIPALTWYEENGYVLLPMGVSDDMALGWAPYDGLIFGLVGAISIAGAVVVVNRRRPT